MVAGAAVIVEEVERVVGIVVARVAEAVIAAGRAIRAEVEERGGAGVERGRRSREKEEMFDGGSRSRSRGRESFTATSSSRRSEVGGQRGDKIGPTVERASDFVSRCFQEIASLDMEISISDRGRDFLVNDTAMKNSEDMKDGMLVMVPQTMQINNLAKVTADEVAERTFVYGKIMGLPGERFRVRIIGRNYPQDGSSEFVEGAVLSVQTPRRFLVPRGLNLETVEILLRMAAGKSVPSRTATLQQGKHCDNNVKGAYMHTRDGNQKYTQNTKDIVVR